MNYEGVCECGRALLFLIIINNKIINKHYVKSLRSRFRVDSRFV